MAENKKPGGLEGLIDTLSQKLPLLTQLGVWDPGTDLYDEHLVEQFAPVQEAVSAYFNVELRGLEHIGEGGALLVGNHGRTGFDAFVMPHLLGSRLGRPVRALADRMLFRAPGLREWLAAMGAVPGTRENAVKLLREGNLVIVYPGGGNEVMKPHYEAYQLSWGRRTGFIRVAQEAGATIHPFAGVGVEEFYHNLPGWDAIERSALARWFEQAVGRRNRGMAPFAGIGPLPEPIDLTFYFGEAIDPGASTDERAVLALQQGVRRRVLDMIRRGLDERPPRG